MEYEQGPRAVVRSKPIKNIEDYPLSKSDPGTPLLPGEEWYLWEITSTEGNIKGRYRTKMVDGERVRVYPVY